MASFVDLRVQVSQDVILDVLENQFLKMLQNKSETEETPPTV